MIEVSINKGKHRITLRVIGFVPGDEATGIDEMIRGAIDELRNVGDQSFDLLIIADAAGPASQKTAENIKSMIVRLSAEGLRKSANVMSSSLAKMQIQRLSERSDRFRFFSDLKAAEIWLDKA